MFFAGPPLLGFIAEYFGIRMSYWVVVPVIVTALLVTKALSAAPMPATSEPQPVQTNG